MVKTFPRVREEMHCGYLPRETWTPGPPLVPFNLGPDRYTMDICAGWLVREQPAVREAAELYVASENKMLERCDPLNLRVVNKAVAVARRAMGLLEADRMPKV